jgi:predicted enzyme related to lactoylglutathione lyase
MKFSEVAFTCYPATDLAASRHFYEEILGLTATTVTPIGEDGGWVEYELGPHTFAIGKTPGWAPHADGPSAALETGDLTATVAALKSAGVVFRMGPLETPVCHMAMIFDPAGNTLMIHQRKPGHH